VVVHNRKHRRRWGGQKQMGPAAARPCEARVHRKRIAIMLFWTIVKVCLKRPLGQQAPVPSCHAGHHHRRDSRHRHVAIGNGAKKQVLSRISAMGTKSARGHPGTGGGSRGVMSGTAQSMKLADAEAICGLAGVRRVAPVVNGMSQLKYENKTSRSGSSARPRVTLSIRDFQVEKDACSRKRRRT